MKNLIIYTKSYLIIYMKMYKDYIVIRRKVKYARLEIKNNKIHLIMPENSKEKPEKLIERHKEWIKRKIGFVKEIEDLSEKCGLFNHKNLEEIVFNNIDEIKEILNVKPEKVIFRKMKRRWASCSSKDKLIFNKLLKFLPYELIRYIVIHELCHLIIKNHRRNFWELIEKICPDSKEKEKLLLTYEFKLTRKNL